MFASLKCVLRGHRLDLNKVTLGHRSELYVHARCTRCGHEQTFKRREWIAYLKQDVR